jgi:polygalacturonase
LGSACAHGAASERADPLGELASVPTDCVRVPEDHATIQAAIDAAPDGGTVLVAPGVYHESLTIAGKSVRLASWYLVDRDPQHILRTVLDGSLPIRISRTTSTPSSIR